MDEITDMGISVQRDKIVINLGVCTGWFGMSRENALEFAKIIKAHAETIPESVGEVD